MKKVVTFGELMLRLTPPGREVLLQTNNLIATFGGAVMGENLAWDIADTLNGMMMIPNLIGVIVLSPIVYRITKNYVNRKIKNEAVEPMLSNFDDIQKEAAEAVLNGAE